MIQETNLSTTTRTTSLQTPHKMAVQEGVKRRVRERFLANARTLAHAGWVIQVE